MDNESKIIGGNPQIVVGHAATPVKTGYQAYACKVRVNDTQIKSVTQLSAGVSSAVTNESWENVALIAGIDYVPFSPPIVSITLNADTDSVMLFLEPIGGYQS